MEISAVAGFIGGWGDGIRIWDVIRHNGNIIYSRWMMVVFACLFFIIVL
jgi:hypothetical protein